MLWAMGPSSVPVSFDCFFLVEFRSMCCFCVEIPPALDLDFRLCFFWFRLRSFDRETINDGCLIVGDSSMTIE